jgi:sugar lactone lactonase YvrE
MDLASDGTQVAALLEDGAVWVDGTVVDGPAGGRAVELVDGAPWILAGDGRMWRVDLGARTVETMGDLDLGGLVDMTAAAGRLWVLDTSGTVIVVEPDGSFLQRLEAPAQGVRALAVDGDRVLAVSTDGVVRAFSLERPAQVIAHVDLDRSDGPVVDVVVVGDELWYVTEAGAVRRQLLDR